jgi:uncharacterized membrane protein
MAMNLSAHKLSVLFLLSLGLNLFFAGMLAVGWWRRPSFEQARRPPGAPEMLFRARDAVGQGRHPELSALLNRRKPALVARRRAVRAARSEVRQALLSEPFDDKRLARGLAALRRETTESQRVLHASLVDIARGLDREQRRRLARIAISDKGKKHKRQR